MLYSVKYRYPGQWFYRTLKDIKADGILEGGAQSRFFINKDEERIELPTVCEFIFNRKRFEVIKASMEASVGQSIPTVQ